MAISPSITPNAAGAPFPPKVGRYEVLLPIASGGMATVYIACVEGIGGFKRQLALKLMHPHLREVPEFMADLVEEAKLAGRIHHPNVVSVIDVGEDAAGTFLVMDYIEGDSLSGITRALRARERLLPPRIALRIVDDALAGLHAAHELKDDDRRPLGIVHRDFSPQNVLVGLDGHSRLADFGVAKAANRLSHTKTGFIKGKIVYMSPEQARAAVVDRRCDVWAAGVVLWELLAGRRLYNTADEVATVLKIVTEEPPRLRTVRPDLPEELDRALASALTISIDERCPNAAELRRLLASAAKPLGGLADTSEVAAFVAPLLEEKLGQRRKRLEELRIGRAPTLIDASRDAVPLPDVVTVSDEPGPKQHETAPSVEVVSSVPHPQATIPGRRVVVGLGVAALTVALGVVWVGSRTVGAPVGGSTPPEPESALPSAASVPPLTPPPRTIPSAASVEPSASSSATSHEPTVPPRLAPVRTAGTGRVPPRPPASAAPGVLMRSPFEAKGHP